MPVFFLPSFKCSFKSLIIFLLIYFFSIVPVIFDGSIQYILEFLYILVFSPFVFKPHPRDVVYLSIIYLFLFTSLFYQDSYSFMLTFKLFSVLFVSICSSSFLNRAGLNLRPVINFFFCLNLFASLFLPTSFSQFIALQDGLVTSGAGGLFFHFHLNAFMIALWFLSLPFKSPFFLILSSVFLLKTNSYSIAVSYFIAVLSRDFLPVLLRSIPMNRLLTNFLLIVSSFSIFVSIYLNQDYISYFLFRLDKSAYVIFSQFFKSLAVFPGLLPGDITQLYSHYFTYDLLSGYEISNELALISISYRLGILSLLILLFFVCKFFRISAIFLFLTLFHYTFIYTPLTYILLYNINYSSSYRSSLLSPSSASV